MRCESCGVETPTRYPFGPAGSRQPASVTWICRACLDGRSTPPPGAQRQDDVLAYVERYHELGWELIPLQPGTKRPLSKWANPLPYADFIQIVQSNPDVNLGVVLGGRSGGLAIQDFESFDSYAQFYPKHEDLEKATLVTKTCHGGVHVFTSSEPFTKAIRLSEDPPVDVLGDGCYAVLPPSLIRHELCVKPRCRSDPPSRYEPLSPGVPHAVMSCGNLVALTMTAIYGLGWKARQLKRYNFPADTLDGVEEGVRNETAFHLARLLLKIDPRPPAIHSMLEAWNSRNRPPLPPSELGTIIQSATKYRLTPRRIKSDADWKVP